MSWWNWKKPIVVEEKKEPKKDINVEPPQLEEEFKIESRPNYEGIKPDNPEVFETFQQPDAQFDQGSATWAYICDYIAKRQEKLRRENDGDMSETSTSKLRGRIAELEELLNLPKEIEFKATQEKFRAEFVTP